MGTLTPTDPLTDVLPEPFMQCLCTNNGRLYADYSVTHKMYDRGAGDIVSTVQDLNVFHRAMRDCRIVRRTSLAQMEDFHPACTYEHGLEYTKRTDDKSGVILLGHEGAYPGSWA